MSIARGVISQSLWCRKFGCVGYVPARGYYRGLGQAFCYNCGARQWSASEGCPDHVEPYNPRLVDRFFLWFTPKYDAWKARRCLKQQVGV